MWGRGRLDGPFGFGFAAGCEAVAMPRRKRAS
jgi:hypothetical protein